jgi:arylsulfatase A-like enzyme
MVQAARRRLLALKPLERTTLPGSSLNRAQALVILLATSAVAWPAARGADAIRPPNILVIITDDQGWGDFGFHGNPHLKTPHLDALAAQSIELTRFHVSPVCTPTRASLLTGRYNYRTGAIDTFLGRASMAPDELTLAEMLSAAGYRTGAFGKWHLGDNYPCRAKDQGFAESLVCRGGGLAQAADPPGNHYLDPRLMRDGREVKSRGYCSDVFTDAAIDFATRHAREPFFAYLAFNCPHTPLEIPPGYESRYVGLGLDDETANVYRMIDNLDDNIGRLLAKLDALSIASRTIVVFLTDNGPQQPRYNGVLRDRKGSVYDGGIRTPCLLRWPSQFAAGTKNDQLAAHIDIVPTLLAACGVPPPSDVAFDGVNLLDVLRGDRPKLTDRELFFQWHRGDQPEADRNCAVRSDRYKLVRPEDRLNRSNASSRWALYDLVDDPGEQRDLFERMPERALQMKAAYHRWFADVSSTRGYPPPRIIAGTTNENPLTLTRQDWRGPQASWTTAGLGFWQVELAASGAYAVTLRMPSADAPRHARLRIGDVELLQALPADADRVLFGDVPLVAGLARVEGAVAAVGTNDWAGVHYVDLDCRQPIEGAVDSLSRPWRQTK